MKTYYKLAIDYSPQTEWVEAPMWLEMSFGALGGGLFIISILQNYLPGIIAGYLVLLAGKGLFLLADLGRPARFLGVMKRPFHSWISFGAWVFLAFAFFGLIFGVQTLSGTSGEFTSLMKVLSLAAAVILIVYDGFFLLTSKGVAGWHSSILPILFGLSALASAVSLALALSLPIPTSLASTFFALLVFANFSYVKGLAASEQTAKVSAEELISGSLKTAYLWGAVIIGSVLPLLVAVLALLGSAPAGLYVVAAACAVLGVFALRYSILKAGYHAPVM